MLLLRTRTRTRVNLAQEESCKSTNSLGVCSSGAGDRAGGQHVRTYAPACELSRLERTGEKR